MSQNSFQRSSKPLLTLAQFSTPWATRAKRDTFRAPDDDMVMNTYADELARFGDTMRQLHIGTTWFGAAAWVVVQHDQRRNTAIERMVNDFTRVYGGLVKRAFGYMLVLYQLIPIMEVEDPHAFAD